MTDKNIITLDVGGKKFRTYKSNLLKSEYFKSKLERWNNDNSNVLFVDEDPEIFVHVLNFLRNSTYSYQGDNTENIKRSLGFYGIDVVADNQDDEQHKSNQIENMTYILQDQQYDYYVGDKIVHVTHKMESNDCNITNISIYTKRCSMNFFSISVKGVYLIRSTLNQSRKRLFFDIHKSKKGKTYLLKNEHLFILEAIEKNSTINVEIGCKRAKSSDTRQIIINFLTKVKVKRSNLFE